MKKVVVLLLVLMLSINLTSCSKQERYEAEFLTLFDTMTQIVAYTDDKEEFTSFANQIHDDLEEYHQLYDIYNDYESLNNIKTINDNAGIKPVKVDRRIIDLLKFSKEEYYRTKGEMNVAMGSVLKIWHNYREDGINNPDRAEIPPKEMLLEAAKHTDIKDVIIDESASTVYLKDKKMSLDVGSVAKGYATEQVCRHIEKSGFESGLVSVGGNVRAIGTKGDSGELWNVGIQDPEGKAGENLCIVYLKDSALVTSGNYERYYVVDGEKYHHLIDKDTLYPSNYFTAVSILCKDSGLADALTTAIYNMPYEEGLKLIESTKGAEAMWVYKDGSTKYSSHFQEYVKK